MIPIASGVRVWIATGHTDMRRGMNSLALLVQEAFKRDPHGGDLYVFRGKSGVDHTVSITDRMRSPEEIAQHLSSAHIILLLVSQNYIKDDFLFQAEMTQAMQRHEADPPLCSMFLSIAGSHHVHPL